MKTNNNDNNNKRERVTLKIQEKGYNKLNNVYKLNNRNYNSS